jgi:hypothetical protein
MGINKKNQKMEEERGDKKRGNIEEQEEKETEKIPT